MTTLWRYTLQLNTAKDADLIEYLSARPNKAAAIKTALRRLIGDESQREEPK